MLNIRTRNISQLKKDFLKKIKGTEAIYLDRRVIAIKLQVNEMAADSVFNELVKDDFCDEKGRIKLRNK